MIVALDSIRETEPGRWLASWTAPSAGLTYYLWLHGIQFATTTDTTYTVVVPEGEIPQLEVATSAADVPLQLLNPGWVDFAFYSPPAPAVCSWFTLDLAVGTAWELGVGGEMENETHYHRLITEEQEDGAPVTLRVTPILEGGQEGTPQDLVVTVVRHPQTPAVDPAYDADTQTVTFAARSY